LQKELEDDDVTRSSVPNPIWRSNIIVKKNEKGRVALEMSEIIYKMNMI